MRLLPAILSALPSPSSGKPYSHPAAVRCAVDASMMTVSVPSASATDSFAAASGRHRNAMSAAAIAFLLAAGSLRSFSGRTMSSSPLREESLLSMRSPVVPSLPSMNIFSTL